MRRAWLALLATVCALGCANTTTFHTNPRGARVYVNGVLCGETPCKYDTRYGFPDRIRVQIEKSGYQDAEFFLDTVPPIATYALFGFGSYLFHTFDEEYRFDLAPIGAMTPVATPNVYPDTPNPRVAAPQPATPSAASDGGDLSTPERAMQFASTSQVPLSEGDGDCAALAPRAPTIASVVEIFSAKSNVRNAVRCQVAGANVHQCEAQFIGNDAQKNFAVFLRYHVAGGAVFALSCFEAK